MRCQFVTGRGGRREIRWSIRKLCSAFMDSSEGARENVLQAKASKAVLLGKKGDAKKRPAKAAIKAQQSGPPLGYSYLDPHLSRSRSCWPDVPANHIQRWYGVMIMEA